jgi:hypothetical protein
MGWCTLGPKSGKGTRNFRFYTRFRTVEFQRQAAWAAGDAYSGKESRSGSTHRLSGASERCEFERGR